MHEHELQNILSGIGDKEPLDCPVGQRLYLKLLNLFFKLPPTEKLRNTNTLLTYICGVLIRILMKPGPKNHAKRCTCTMIAIWLITLFSFPIFAQQSNIHFSPLGSTWYQTKIAALEKSNIPKRYTEQSAQAWYQEMITDRNNSLIHLFKDNSVIYDTLLLNKCNTIAQRIVAANTNYHFDSIQFYINRSYVPNAACYGEGTIMVNLGLFLWLDNDDELALVLAHEMSHQVLNHLQSRLDKNIATLTSAGFTEELKDIKKSKDGKYDRFRKLMKSFTVENGRHGSYKESEADSLAAILMQQAGFNVANGAITLLKLDNSDAPFTAPTFYSLKDFFAAAPIDQSFFVVKSKYHGLSSAAVTMNADQDFDSVKTHPDCVLRYQAITRKSTRPAINCCTSLTTGYGNYKERAMLEIVRNLYENNDISLCAHFCIFALQNHYSNAIYNDFLSLCFSQLYYSDKHLQRFNAVNVKALRETTLKSLQDYLFDAGITDLDKLSVYCLTKAAITDAEDMDFALTMRNIQITGKDATATIATFNRKYPNSKYQYLLKLKSP